MLKPLLKNRYKDLLANNNYIFIPFVIESLAPTEVKKEKKFEKVSGEPRSSQYLFQLQR